MRQASKGRHLFLIIEMILYVSFLWMDLFSKHLGAISNQLKMLSIVLCFVYVIWSKEEKENNNDLVVLRFALFFTCLADVCLLLQDWYVPGLSCFIMVQLIYRYRLQYKFGQEESTRLKRFEELLKSLWANILFALIMMLFFYLLKISMDITLILTILYFSLFVQNLWYGWSIWRHPQERTKRLLVFLNGLLLFFLCDISVGLYNMTSYLTLPHHLMVVIEDYVGIAMWLFYLPGKVLIALSGGISNTRNRKYM